MTGGQEESGAPTLGSTERLGKPGPANFGTLHSLPMATRSKMKTPPGAQTVAFLGGSKQAEDDYFILDDDDDRANADITTPGHLHHAGLVDFLAWLGLTESRRPKRCPRCHLAEATEDTAWWMHPRTQLGCHDEHPSSTIT